MSQFVFEPVKFLMIVGAAICASTLSELISYFLLYRKEDYKLNKGKYLLIKLKLKGSIKSLINSRVLMLFKLKTKGIKKRL